MNMNRRENRYRSRFCLLLVGLLGMPLSQPLAAPAQHGSDRFESVRQLIRRKLANHSTPSVAVAVAQHGRIIWEEGFGWANREKKIPATADTPYSLASVSKPFTATGLMVLVQAGKIDLDRPVNDYLGKAKLTAWVGDAREATVRRVANHSSGLPLHAQFFLPGRQPSDDETIRKYGNIVTVPGQHFQYSNIGYGVLGHVVSRVSGKSYGEFMRDAVFRKLGLAHTAVNVPPALEKLQAIRYDENGAPIPFYESDHAGASSVYSSAHDLVRFGMFHLKDHLADQKPILSDSSIDEMHRATMNVGNAITRNGNGYGVGWGVGDNRVDGYRVLAHGGGMPGVSTEIMLVPSEDIAVAVLLNARDHDSAYPIANAILKVLLPKWQMTMPRAQAAMPFHPDAKLAGTWKGALHTYQGNRPATITISSSGDVHVKLGDRLESVLNHVQFRDGALSGEAWGDIGIPDAERRQAYSLLFDLKLRGKVLSGPVSARSIAGESVNHGALTQWFEVKKQ
jgi:CubicO group peptidase (beta-lactamase class C family)